jgi:hypothetical protein
VPSQRSFAFIQGTHDFSPKPEVNSQLKPSSQHFSALAPVGSDKTIDEAEEKQLWPRCAHSHGLPRFVSIRAGYNLHGSFGLSHSSSIASFGAFGRNVGIGPHKFRLNANETVFRTGKRKRGTLPENMLPCNKSTSNRLNLESVSGIGPVKKLS